MGTSLGHNQSSAASSFNQISGIGCVGGQFFGIPIERQCYC